MKGKEIGSDTNDELSVIIEIPGHGPQLRKPKDNGRGGTIATHKGQISAGSER